METRIALDAMGGDAGAGMVVPAALHTLKREPGLRLVLVGDQALLEDLVAKNGGGPGDGRLTIHHASQVVEMGESPSHALRNKKDSSMRVAIDLVKEGEVQACVSAGNTGALMATARFVLRMLPGVDRPAICTTLPGLKSDTFLLDLGANVDSSSEQMFQFAVMGAILARAVENIPNPRVGLLNVGEEEIKGNDRVKQTAALLAESGLNYIGFVEGDDIYTGDADVIVCDGFVGNVALKSSEGVAQMITEFVREEFSRNLYTRFTAMLARPVLKAVQRRIDPRRYNGASLLGLRGTVVKSHGSADSISFATAIRVAMLEAEKDVPETISRELEAMLLERSVS